MLFQAVDSSGFIYERIAIILGLITLILALASLASCRSCLSWLNYLGVNNLLKNKGYLAFYKYHSIFWWLFGVALASHIFMAIGHTGLPQAGDPDAGSHWLILIPGFFGALFSLSIFSSCRIFPKLITPGSTGQTLSNTFYRVFFKYHVYYWLAFGLLIIFHFFSGFSHSGLWPSG
jgi:hypothetical protein